MPGLIGQTCLLVEETLSPFQLSKCISITTRAYGTFDRFIQGLGFLTGANTLDVASIGIDLALLTANTTLMTDAYRRAHAEVVIKNEIKADGLRPDSSFGQVRGYVLKHSC